MVETLAPEVFSFICCPFSQVYFPVTCSSFSWQCVSTVASKSCACNHVIFTCRIRFGLWEVIDPLLSNERRKVESLRHSQENCCSLFFFLPGSFVSWSITPEGFLGDVFNAVVLLTDLKPHVTEISMWVINYYIKLINDIFHILYMVVTAFICTISSMW